MTTKNQPINASIATDETNVADPAAAKPATQRRSVIRSLTKAMVVFGISGLAVIGLAPAAHAASGDTYTAKAFSCGVEAGGNRVVTARPPSVTASPYQRVTWTAYLYKWNPSTGHFVLYAWSPIEGGLAWPTGGSYAFNPGGGTIVDYKFGVLPAGYYEVLNSMTWQDGATAAAWSWNSSSSWYCSIA